MICATPGFQLARPLTNLDLGQRTASATNEKLGPTSSKSILAKFDYGGVRGQISTAPIVTAYALPIRS
jgi:hypothetical protein